MPLAKTTSKRVYINGLPRVVKIKSQQGGSIMTEIKPLSQSVSQPVKKEDKPEDSEQAKEKTRKKVFDLMSRL